MVCFNVARTAPNAAMLEQQQPIKFSALLSSINTASPCLAFHLLDLVQNADFITMTDLMATVCKLAPGYVRQYMSFSEGRRHEVNRPLYWRSLLQHVRCYSWTTFYCLSWTMPWCCSCTLVGVHFAEFEDNSTNASMACSQTCVIA